MFHVHSPKHAPNLWGIQPLQRSCHALRRPILLCIGVLFACIAPARAEPPKNDYPTQARVEYVNECIERNGDKLSRLYQCSCVIDDIANRLTYDEFVEATTFSRYATLPGEGGGIFRDPEQGKAKAKLLREIEKNAYRACGISS
jgi:hypothetical protein